MGSSRRVSRMSGCKEYSIPYTYFNSKNDDITRVNKTGNSIIDNDSNGLKIVHSRFTNIKDMYTLISEGFGFQESRDHCYKIRNHLIDKQVAITPPPIKPILRLSIIQKRMSFVYYQQKMKRKIKEVAIKLDCK